MRCGLTVVGAAFFPPHTSNHLGKKPQDLCQNSVLHSLNRDAAAVCVDVCVHRITAFIPTSSLKNPVAGGQL